MSGRTLPQRVRDRAVATGDEIALREKRLGLWEEITWAQYWMRASEIAHALLSVGIRPGDRVAVHCENRCEWLYADIGITSIRAATVGIYPTSPTAEVLHYLRDSGARVLIVEDQEQLDKTLAVIDELPELEHIVYIEPRGIRGAYAEPRLVSWEEFLARGQEHAAAHRDEVTDLLEASSDDDLATIVYTSGTTGAPKGAMLGIGNIRFVTELIESPNSFFGTPPGPHDLYVSYLPLCHAAERLFTTWMNAATGAQVNFAESIDTVQHNLREIQPTILLAVPRIWEKMLAGIHTKQAVATPLKRAVLRAGLALARRTGAQLVANHGRHTLRTRLEFALGWLTVFRALREKLGVSRVRYAVSGAAPIAPEVLELFMGLGVPVHELYGGTENSALATANRPGRIRLGTVGEPHENTEVRLGDDGEILTRSGATFQGYWNRPDATAEVIDEDGWLHTGDVGEWVEETHLRVTDRIKDIIITAGGKNISPSEIENALKASPYIKEAIVIGDRRKFLTALIGIEQDVVSTWARSRKITYTSYRDLSEKQELRTVIAGIVADVNTRLASVETIKDFRMLPHELDQDRDELTATQKVKRSVINKTFAAQIDSMYGGAS